jgi:small GTP-binding protein
VPNRSSSSSGLFLIVAAAAAGYAAITLPPVVSEGYERIQRVNPDLALAYLALVLVIAVAIGGYIVYKCIQIWRRSRRKAKRQKLPSKMSAPQIEKEIAERHSEVQGYLEAVTGREQEQLAARLAIERTKLAEQTLEIAAFGTISSGKSSLLNSLAGKDVFVTDVRGGTTTMRNETDWPGHGKVRLIDTPGLGEMHGARRAETAIEAARSADLILYVSDGVLRDFEFDVLRRLTTLEKRILVCLNKEDTFSARDREGLLQQMAAQLKGIVPVQDFVTVRANPGTRTRVRVTPAGQEIEEQVVVEPDVSALASRMIAVLDKEGERLLLANLLVRSRGLVSETKARVRAQLEQEARDLVGRYMWQAGGAAALSPFPLLDIAAGLGISYKMVIDLAQVFRQQIDLDSAREMVAQAGKILMSSAGASLATPGLAALAASALKTIPGVGTIAGGAMQGLVQALVTRWIGLVFIEYFRNEMTDPDRVLPELARTQWAEVTRPSSLARLVQEGMRRFGDKGAEDAR